MAGRPKKPGATKALEGNRSRRKIPKALPLQGLPEKPEGLSDVGERFWKLVSGELGAIGVAKRIDGPGLTLCAQAWEFTQVCFANGDIDGFSKAVTKWLALAGRYGLTAADRERLTIAATDNVDEDEERFFGVTG